MEHDPETCHRFTFALSARDRKSIRLAHISLEQSLVGNNKGKRSLGFVGVPRFAIDHAPLMNSLKAPLIRSGLAGHPVKISNAEAA
jgi:hypothetical protein